MESEEERIRRNGEQGKRRKPYILFLAVIKAGRERERPREEKGNERGRKKGK